MPFSYWLYPRFGVPRFAGRNYFLLCGRLSASVEMAECDVFPTAPNFAWPVDRSWIVVSDIDVDSTFIGCSNHVANLILSSKAIEGKRADPWQPLPAD